MSARPGFNVTTRIACDGGESPNAYVPQVTVEVRVHYPSRQVPLASEVLEETITRARNVMAERLEEFQQNT